MIGTKSTYYQTTPKVQEGHSGLKNRSEPTLTLSTTQRRALCWYNALLCKHTVSAVQSMTGILGPVYKLSAVRKIKSVYKIKILKQSDQSNFVC